MKKVIPMGNIWVDADTPLPKRHAWDEYRTPVIDVRKSYEVLLQHSADLANKRCPIILDIGAGETGVWGKVAREFWPSATIVGVEIQPFEQAKEYDWWFQDDFIEWSKAQLDGFFDLVIGNPPFYCCNQIVQEGLRLLSNSGTLTMLLRLGFAAGQKRRDELFKVHPPRMVSVFSKRISFTQDGRTDARDYALFQWHKGHNGPTELNWIS